MAGLAPSVPEVLRRLQSLGLCLGVDASDQGEENTRSLFDRVVSAFLKEKREAQPLPALASDGRPLHLLALFRVVRERGGYASVSASCAWAAVSEAIGLDLELGPSLKLVYVKYLDALDRCLDEDINKKAAGDTRGVEEISGDLATEVDGSFLGISDRKQDYKTTLPFGSGRNHLLTPARGNERRLLLGDSCGGNDGDCMTTEQEKADAANVKSPVTRKKRRALVGMLNWIVKVAKNPGDPSIARISAGRAKATGSEFGQVFSLLLLARKALFVDILPAANNRDSLLQVVNKIYDDDLDKDPIASGEYYCGKQGIRDPSLLPDVVCGVPYEDRKPVRVGPAYQHEIPDWSPVAVAISNDPDDRRLCGTQIWHPHKKRKKPAEHDAVGKGRQDTCSCECPGSVSCVKFHIAENRLQLKHELGSAFDAMGLDTMGEEAALSWTEEEERRFKAVLRLNPPCLRMNLWDQLQLSFPLKGRQNLVRYYFNVFLLRRRSYQNRMAPDRINSDDEDTQFGFLSNPAGNELNSLVWAE